MSTRSFIGLEATDGTVAYIYCHWDGYLAHNGRMLQDNYTTVDQVNALLDQGDASALGRTVADSVFYTRDKGEDRGENLASIDPSREEFGQDLGDCTAYLFSTDMNSWTVTTPTSKVWVGLRRALEAV
jgi:hypothetical protein|tara:strand:- start:117 stop:500 length:384 start_codon:yes stop_codon:yes gene_type:complete